MRSSPPTNGVYRKTELESGVRIVTEAMPHVRSLAIGFWFDTGSRDEPEELAGISHYLEHMNFKGTKDRSSQSIVRQVEGRGGHLNAFTSQENTCFYARVISEHLTNTVDVLADITQNSVYAEGEVDRERGVILEELKNVEDTPDEWVFDHFMQQMFPDHPMGRPVIGTRQALAKIGSKALHDYRARRYNGSRIIVAAAGHLNHDNLIKLLERRLKAESSDGSIRTLPATPESASTKLEVKTTTQQAHLVWGCRSYPYDNPHKYPLMILNTLLGGGASSRLFQNIREKHGLAYSVYSFHSNYSDCGVFGVYAGCEPKHAENTLSLVEKEIRQLTKAPISKRELTHYRDQLKGSLLLGLESPSSCMHRLAKMEMNTGKWYSVDEVVKQIDAVTPEQIHEVALELFEKQACYTTLLLPNGKPKRTTSA